MSLPTMSTAWIEERRRDAMRALDQASDATRWSRRIASLGREVADLETELRRRGVTR